MKIWRGKMSNKYLPNEVAPTGDTDAFTVTAPVELPTQEQMKVKLVPLHLLTRFEEARSDEQYWGSVFWTLIGIILGAVIAWLASDPIRITIPSLVIVLIIVALAVITCQAFRKYKSRADYIRTEIAAMGEIVSD
jgi:hypothetical protein